MKDSWIIEFGRLAAGCVIFLAGCAAIAVLVFVAPGWLIGMWK